MSRNFHHHENHQNHTQKGKRRKENVTGESQRRRRKFQQYTVAVSTQAEQILHEIMPQKIEELQKMFDCEFTEFKQAVTLPEIFESSSIDEEQRRATDNWVKFGGNKRTKPVPQHAEIKKMAKKVRTEGRYFLEQVSTLKLWIQLHIPTQEEGANFGVEVQDETLAEMDKVEAAVISIIDGVTRYYSNRGAVTVKILKYGQHIPDYTRAVLALDETMQLDLKLGVAELRNAYISTLDLVLKNEARLMDPRNSSMHTVML